MSRAHSNYKREIRARKRNAMEMGVSAEAWMATRARGGDRAATRWCRNKGVDVPSLAGACKYLLRPENVPTWWVVHNQAERSVYGPIRVDPHEWDDDGRRVQNLAGSHGTATAYFSEQEASTAAAELATLYDTWNREDDRREMECLGFGPL